MQSHMLEFISFEICIIVCSEFINIPFKHNPYSALYTRSIDVTKTSQIHYTQTKYQTTQNTYILCKYYYCII